MSWFHVCLLVVNLLVVCHGQCPIATLNTFLQNSSIARTLSVDGSYSLPSSGMDNSNVLSGSYMLMKCSNGYTYGSGQLNITCIGNSWTPFPSCIPNSDSGAVTPTNNSSSCVIDTLTTFNITNGYFSNSSLSYISSTSGLGWIQFTCMPGFVLDPTVGGMYTCNNGVWSTKPRCLMTGRCSYANLQNFITSSNGLQPTDQSRLMAAPQDANLVFNGSFIVVACANGFTNTGGGLNVTCMSNGSWSSFPNCVLNTGNSAMNSTPMSMGSGSPCMIDTATTFNITNGFLSGSALSYASTTTANGWIQFACMPGFVLDPVIGPSYTCNNGVWSLKPRCLMTGRCSYSTLQNFISSAIGLQTTDQSRLMAATQDASIVFNGSFIVLACAPGYMNIAGGLNVTCMGNGSWSPFPSCVLNTGNGAMTTTSMSVGSGSPCMIDATTTFNITNGFYSSTSLSYTSPTYAAGSIQFACMPGYVLDPMIGSSYICNSGVWSPKPRCLMTGRCSYTTLQNFISTSFGVQTTGQSRLMTAAQETNMVLNDSFIILACVTDYMNSGGSLNVTCMSNGSWSPFPNCVLNNNPVSLMTTTLSTGVGAMTTTSISSSTGASCIVDAARTFNTTNGYFATSTLTFISATTATGSIQFACIPGFVLDPSIGPSYTCNNGVWSPKPQCLMTGRCSYASLQNFITSSNGLQTTDQSRLMAASQDATVVLNGSFILLACANGFMNIGGSLNITCLGNGSWSSFPNCILNTSSSGMSSTPMPTGSGSPCMIDTATTFNITNGFLSSSTLSYTSTITANGWIQFACMPGFVLDPVIGPSYTCNNSVWSPKPRCLMTGRCLYSALQTFVSTANGLQTTDQSRLMAAPQDTSVVLNGSFIVLACARGYMNIGGSLNVTCLGNGSWSAFPSCILNTGNSPTTTTTLATGGGAMTTTATMASGNGSPCMIDAATTFLIANGYYSSSSLSYISAVAVTGSIQFACMPGFTLDPTIGPSYTCNNGIWSSKPRCLMTARCSFSALQNFISTSTGLQTTDQKKLMAAAQDSSVVFGDSFILLACAPGYMNIGGSLNVTCLGNSSWTSFPNCILNTGNSPTTTTTLSTGGGAMTTTTSMAVGNGSSCMMDAATTFTIANGYYSSSSLSYTSATTVTGSIQFACMPGFALDPTIGPSYTCNNGVWSSKPRCLMSARCAFSALQNFISTSSGLQITDQRKLMAASQDSSVVFSDSFMVLACAPGYMNIGGSLNVTCLGNSSWTSFPSCILKTGNGSTTTTTLATGGGAMTTTTSMSAGNGSPCMIDAATTFLIANGYYSSSSLSYISATTVTGSIQFACMPGYMLDPTIGPLFTCNNGIWSTKPRCLITARCSFSTLQNFISSAIGIQPTDQRKLMAASQDASIVFSDSFIVFICTTGYMNTGGSLNVTCTGNGSWSPFPNCILSTGGGSLTTTTISASNGSPCMIDATTFTITNGYFASSALSYISTSSATGSVQFACIFGFVLDPSIGALYTCNNGIWSSKPRCLMTARCSFSTLQNFISSAIGVQPTDQKKLMAASQDTSVVFSDSFIVLMCAPGYMNTGGSLNVTCLSSGSWSPFPNCILNNGNSSMTTTTISTGSGSSCMIDATTTFTIANGYFVTSSLSYMSTTTATGSIQFACTPGFVLDPSIGASYTCNNGVWSTKPRCLITGRCAYSILTSFISTAPGIQVTNQTRLAAASQDANAVLNGSFIVFACVSGYTNTGGSLNVTCLGSGSWTPFPNCVLNTGGGPLTTTAMSSGNGSPCVIDATTLTITNGFLANSSLSYMSTSTATGWIQFACMSGFVLDPTIGAFSTCNNGIWSSKPQCLMTGRCSYSPLKTFISGATTLQVTSQYRLIATAQDANAVLNDSYIVFTCISGYVNIGGSLNVTCLANGSWTPFPNCVLNTGSGSLTTTAVPIGNSSPCAIDAITFTITNGFLANSSLSYISTSTATGWIQFACMPGYVVDSTIGPSYTCNNGVWSTKPRCLITSRCSYATLQNFISVAIGIQTTDQSRLIAAAQETNAVLNGSFIVLACANGFINTGGTLNITCLGNGSWTPFPTCVLNTGSGSMTTTTVSTGNGSPCVVDSTTFTISNGFLSNSALSYTSISTATGTIQFNCISGFTLDPSIGTSYICNNGLWSPKPRCLMTGRCSYLVLNSFISTANTLQTTNQFRLLAAPHDTNAVLSDSFLVLACINGYVNNGGSLNVTCLGNSSWSQFPNCVLNTGSGSMVTTTMTTINGSPCIIDATTYTITNGSFVSSSLSYTSTTTVTGTIQFTCMSGFTLDPTIGASYICNNGIWSPKPRCLMTSRCSYSTLQNFLATTMGLQATNQSRLLAAPQETSAVLHGSFIVFSCANGYTNTGGSLNVTCLRNSSWSQFPNCVLNAQAPTVASSGGAFCTYNSALLTITNGYASAYNGIMSPTANQALPGAYIDYVCVFPSTLLGNSRITCTNGSWSAPPTCIVSNPAGTTSIVQSTSNCSTIPSVANGFVSSTTFLRQNNNIYSSKVEYTCSPGYVYVSTSNQRSVSCANGVWDPLPVCTVSLTCSFTQLSSALVNVRVISRSLNSGASGVLAGGWIQVDCGDGYRYNPLSGPLNITCLATGSWTQFPICSQ